MNTKDDLANTALEESRVKQKYLLKLLSHPLCLFPFLAGLTDLLVLWAFDIWSGPALFAGLAAILGSLGLFFTRLVVGDNTLARQVIQTVQREVLVEREKRLDDLDRRLCEADNDPRPERYLRDLRALAKAFEQGEVWKNVLSGHPSIDILAGVDKLFKECVISLEKTLDLGYASAQTATEAARKPILQQRERIITDVAKSIQQLGTVLAGIQSLESKVENQQGSELAAIRRELNQSLEVARKVKERISLLDKDLETKV